MLDCQITIFWTIQPFFIFFCIKIEYHKVFKMMLSLFWKNARFPKKGQNGAKVGGAVGKINFFVFCCKLANLIFLIFHINLEGIKGYKLAQMPFLGKFLFCQFSPFLLIFGKKLLDCQITIFWTIQPFFIIFCIKIVP